MPRDLGPEIAQAGPIESLIKVHFRDGDGAPVFGLRENAAFAVINRRDHPIGFDVRVGAADEENVIFAGARGGEQRITAGDGKGDNFRAVIAQLTRDLRKEAVVADHHADFA